MKITNFFMLTPEEKLAAVQSEKTAAPVAAKVASACPQLEGLNHCNIPKNR